MDQLEAQKFIEIDNNFIQNLNYILIKDTSCSDTKYSLVSLKLKL